MRVRRTTLQHLSLSHYLVIKSLRSVTCERVHVYGHRTVRYTTPGGRQLTIAYLVADIRLSRLSVAQLLLRKWELHLTEDQRFLRANQLTLPLVKRGALLYVDLPRTVPQPQPGPTHYVAPTTTQGADYSLPKPSGGQKDDWRMTSSHLIRVHMRPRTTIFIPTGNAQCPLTIADTTRHRTTIVLYEDKKTPQSIADDFTKDDATRTLSTRWTGETQFELTTSKMTVDSPPGLSSELPPIISDRTIAVSLRPSGVT